ncbi:glycoside hydrolase family 3 C-terminal domain-containing protein [Micromonospora sp. KC721]|uniref:glycoside hydrolase family 3 C-terminal domain-containing protein n=1 Tax=Micromonospora sp. KC721 TaxID=2530380 RepID=UPI001045B867|nr:glycoside hydrolase family 3 C-terminal domain-containing protein [Micromonospora sp. KC721]TDB82464.1 carbohydrate-binding protein [Micromonospora sp. KC721]
MTSVESRAQAILAQLTLDEKIAMLYGQMPAVDRLGLTEFHTGGEAVHGLVASSPTTVFPQAVGLAATWNPDLMGAIGSVILAELEALLPADPPDPRLGRNLWAPVVNLLRDPRWGRNEEGYSEDPHLTVALAVAYCRSLRGDASQWRVAPTLKHFTASNHENDKFGESVSVRPRVLHEYDLPPFLEPIRAGVVASVMPSYNVVNGRPNHVSPHLRLLREEDPDVVIIADGHASADIVKKSHFYENFTLGFAGALRAGLDSFTDDLKVTMTALYDAFRLGLLSEEDIDPAVGRILRMRLRLTDAFQTPAPTGTNRLNTPDHERLAREAMRQSIVLLQNDGLLPLHPEDGRTVAVLGPLADRVCRDWYGGIPPYRVTPLDGLRSQVGDSRVVFVSGLDRIALRLAAGGDYLAVASGDDALRVAAGKLTDAACFDVFDWGEGGLCLRSVGNGRFLSLTSAEQLRCDKLEPYDWNIMETFRLVRDGSSWLLQNHFTGRYAAIGDDGLAVVVPDADAATRLDLEVVHRGTEMAAEAARAADAVIVLVGTYPHINGREMRDRDDLNLPAAQEELTHAVIDANPHTAVVLVTGHPVAVPRIAERARALLWSSHGGQEFGNGLADVLLGVCSPAGRLPQTWPRDVEDLPDIRDYDIIKSRLTYLYSDRDPLFAFGHGLTYAEFRYRDLAVEPPVAAPGGRVTITGVIDNVGPADSDDVVQLYVRALDSPVPRPRRELVAFDRIMVPVNAKRQVEFSLAVDRLSFWDVGRGRFAIAPGRYEFMLGRSATAIECTAILTVQAPELPPRDLSTALVRAVDFDDYEAVRIIDETPRQGEAVLASQPGAWLLFRDADLGAGVDRVVARLGGGEPGARIEVRLDHPVNGRLLGDVDVVEPDLRGWATVEAPLAPAEGRHDLYLVFSAPARLASFALHRSAHEFAPQQAVPVDRS